MAFRHLTFGAAAALALALFSTEPADAQIERIRLGTLATIGVADGDPRYVFGAVEDVTVDRRGNVYVLDSHSMNVRVFSRGGRFVQQLGRPGRGPGEFFAPQAMAIDGADRLYVLDPGNARVHVFTPGTAGHAYTAYFRVNFDARDLCASRDRIYVLGPRFERVIHEFMPDGRWIRSFGAPLGGSDPLMVASLAGGALACMQESGDVLYLSQLTPLVRRYSSSQGRMEWQQVVPGYRAVSVVKGSDGSVTLRAGRTGVHDVASSIAELHPGWTLVQVGPVRAGARHRFEFSGIRSFVVSNETGAARPLQNPLPRLVWARNGYAASVRTEPFPAVSLYQIRYHERSTR
jgi:hypothetical protein